MKLSKSMYLIAVSVFFLSATIFSQSINLSNLEVTKIADGFQFVEGPVWKSGALLFSDIPANTIYKLLPGKEAEVFLKPSGNSNGLALDNSSNLLLTQHGERRVVRLETDGSQTVLASHYKGKRLNSPNDLAVKSDGAVFFTDPPYGIQKEQEELGFYGIYSISPNGGLYLLDKSLNRPNGIAFSPDEKKLYVDDCEVKIIYVWDVVNDTTIANKTVFARMDKEGSGADGMKIDSEGRLFCTGPNGVWVFNPGGTLVTVIEIPGQTTNCNWGGENGNTLYVTSGDAVYSVKEK